MSTVEVTETIAPAMAGVTAGMCIAHEATPPLCPVLFLKRAHHRPTDR